MPKRLAILTVAFTLLQTAAWADGVIVGQVTEAVSIDRAIIGPHSYVTTTDGRKYKVSGVEGSVLIATQLALPEAVVALPEARPSSLTAPVLMAPVPRGPDPVPVLVVAADRGVEAGFSTIVFLAEPISLQAVQPGGRVAVAGGLPVVREEGWYVQAAPTAQVAVVPVRLRDGRMVLVGDSIGRTAIIEAEVDFDPSALVPGEYVTVTQREGGRYFLSRAAAPRRGVRGVPGGIVTHVDPAAQVITLSDGSLVHPRPGESRLFRIHDQPVDLARVRPGTVVVIHPGPALPVDAPSALPGDVIFSGRLLTIEPAPSAAPAPAR